MSTIKAKINISLEYAEEKPSDWEEDTHTDKEIELFLKDILIKEIFHNGKVENLKVKIKTEEIN